MQLAIEALHAQLGSKKTFIQAVNGLHAVCTDPSFYEASSEVHNKMAEAVLRGGTLLQSRYTSKLYWTPGTGYYSLSSSSSSSSMFALLNN